jgi:WD40 repeat protein
MTICLNPHCPNPQNPDQNLFCQNCGQKLLLGDKYRAVKPIGSGNYSRTFVGFAEPEMGKTQCIIKQFRHQSKQTASSFDQELEVMAILGQHPQIPALIDALEKNDRQYLIQEFIPGKNLEAELRETGSFNEANIRELLESILPVLHLIHNYGLIHRDIKPDNIIRSPQNNFFVLVDFGVAKQMNSLAMLSPGTMVGSAEYTAPEQLMGQAVFASDIYSLGVTCVHLLTEMTPFDLFDSLEGVWVWRDYLRSAISPTLARILEKMLLPVSHRYDSAKAVLADLNPTLSRQLIKQLPKSYQTKAKKFPKSTTSSPISPETSQQPSPLAIEPLAIEKISPPQTVNELPSPVVAKSVAKSPRLPQWQCVQTLNANTNANTANGGTAETPGIPEVTAIAFSPQCRALIAGCADGTIKLWDFTTGELLHTLTAHPHSVTCLAITPNGQTLVSGSADGRILVWRLWQLGTAELHQGVPPTRRFELTGHSSVVASVAIAPDGLTLASGSRDQTICLWNLPTGELKQTLKGHSQQVTCVAFNPNRHLLGDLLASGSADQKIKLWQLDKSSNPGELAELAELTGHLGAVYGVAIAPDGRQLISSSWDRTIKIWDLQTRQVLHSLTGHGLPSTTLAISPNGKTFASGSYDATIKLWDLATGQLQATLTEHSKAVTSVIFSPDGKTLASGSSDGTVKVWRCE